MKKLWLPLKKKKRSKSCTERSNRTGRKGSNSNSGSNSGSSMCRSKVTKKRKTDRRRWKKRKSIGVEATVTGVKKQKPIAITARAEITNVLRQAAIGWAVKRRYSAYPEICPVVGLGRRVDVMMLSTRGHLIAVEIKSCAADLRADDKWQEYLPYCHRLYFCVSHAGWQDPRFQTLLLSKIEGHRSVGIMVLRPDGHAKVVRSVKQDNEVKLSTVRRVALKLAWIGGKSKANSRRVRCYIRPPDPRLI